MIPQKPDDEHDASGQHGGASPTLHGPSAEPSQGKGPELGPAACLLTALERQGVFRAIDLLQAGWREFVPDGQELVIAGDGIEVTRKNVRLKFDTQITLTLPRAGLSLGGVLRKEQAHGSQETQAQQ